MRARRAAMGTTGEDVTANMRTVKDVPRLRSGAEACATQPHRPAAREVHAQEQLRRVNAAAGERRRRSRTRATPRRGARQKDPAITANRDLHFIYAWLSVRWPSGQWELLACWRGGLP
ncbi:MAG: hypothetical protein ACLVKI_12710 [Gordonibacter urolithinfaciens]